MTWKTNQVLTTGEMSTSIKGLIIQTTVEAFPSVSTK